MNAAPFRQLLLGTSNADGTESGVTTGTSQAIDCKGYVQLTAYLKGVGTSISDGTVILEEASYQLGQPYYSGTWSAIYTFTCTAVSGGAQQAYHFPAPSAFMWVRARIGTTVSGSGSPGIMLVLEGV